MNCVEHCLPELELSTGLVREALQCIIHTILFIRSPPGGGGGGGPGGSSGGSSGGVVVPYDVECEGFTLTYVRIGNNNNNICKSNQQNRSTSTSKPISQHQQPPSTSTTTSSSSFGDMNSIDIKVNDGIERFLSCSLTQIGPELLSGHLALDLFERRSSRQLFGLVSHEERIIFERWMIRIVVNNTPRPIGNDTASIIERQRMQDTADSMLRIALHSVYDMAFGNGASNNGSGGSGGTSSCNGIDHIPPTPYEFDIVCSPATGNSSSVGAAGAGLVSAAGRSNRSSSSSGGGGGGIVSAVVAAASGTTITTSNNDNNNSNKPGTHADDRENVYSRVTNMPPILNLGGR